MGKAHDIQGRRRCNRRVGAVAIVIILLFSPCGTSVAQTNQLSEYQIKAAYLLNFTRFVEWPTNAFPKTNSSFVIGVAGINPFGDELQRVFANQDVVGHRFEIRDVTRVSEARECHLLFVCRSERRHVDEILGGLAQRPVLTVSDIDRFNQDGGIVRLFMEGRKVRFEINDAQARRNGLKISSKLLSLAKRPESP
jgi:hypothetical protein